MSCLQSCLSALPRVTFSAIDNSGINGWPNQPAVCTVNQKGIKKEAGVFTAQCEPQRHEKDVTDNVPRLLFPCRQSSPDHLDTRLGASEYVNVQERVGEVSLENKNHLPWLRGPASSLASYKPDGGSR